MQEYWHKQTKDKPLFPELEWSRPENKVFAGKLLVVGGDAQNFAAPAEAYTEALKAGVGVARVLLPDALQKTVGRVFEAGEYAPSTPSGSFAQKALVELLGSSHWADGVLLAGNFGKNSETAILLEKFVTKYTGQLTLTGDSIDYFLADPTPITNRANTLLVPNFSQLQKLCSASRFPQPLTSSMDLLHFVETLHNFSETHTIALIISHLENIVITTDGQVSTTKSTEDNTTKIATHAAVWWLQNPSKTFEALTTSSHTVL